MILKNDNLVAKIDTALRLASKPSRYLGNEFNSISKEHSAVSVKVALAFPDVYEVGMSHLGLRILYHLINSRPDFLAERVFAPWFDFEEVMWREDIPLFSLETRTPLREFDIIGFTLPYEMSYTNLLYMLHLAKIPLRSAERGEDFPLIIAGGVCAVNPEPLAEFIDVFCIGDGEELVIDLLDEYKCSKEIPKEKLLLRLAQIRGVYVPSLYEIKYNSDNTISGIFRRTEEAPIKIERRVLSNLDDAKFPLHQVVPFLSIIHDRATLEVERGCSRGCRFCQAGIIYRPKRERKLHTLIEYAKKVIKFTGYEQLSLTSLNIIDYTHIVELVEHLVEEFKEIGVSISLPSLRVDPRASSLASTISKIKKTGLTLALEAATERLQRVINKQISREHLLDAISDTYKAGWKLIKLYFMVGLPTEEEEDLLELVKLVNHIKKIGKGELKVNISPFVPKPHTPFQWVKQSDVVDLNSRQKFLMHRLSHKNISLTWQDPQVSFLEGIFARGDRRLGKVLYEAFKVGRKFDSWPSFFSFRDWMEAFARAGVDPQFYTRERAFDEVLPWDHIAIGVKKRFLIREYEKALMGEVTPSCKERCSDCGVCEGKLSSSQRMEVTKRRETSSRAISSRKYRVRMKYAKGEEMKYLSHLEMGRVLSRSMRRAEIPIVVTKGYTPHLKLSYAPPLQIGVISKAEFVDLELTRSIDVNELKLRISKELPKGIQILDLKYLSKKENSLASSINLFAYRLEIEDESAQEKMREFMDKDALWIKREIKGKEKEINVRKFVEKIEIKSCKGNRYSLILLLKRDSSGATVKPTDIASLIFKRVLSIERIGQFYKEGYILITPMGEKVPQDEL